MRAFCAHLFNIQNDFICIQCFLLVTLLQQHILHLPLFDIVSEYDYYDTNIIIILFFERNVSDSINR